MNKYHNKKTEIDGITFDSKKEAQRYSELKLLERAGEIISLAIQPKFTLQNGFKKNGKKILPITYTADFMYYDKKLKKTVVEDVKGIKTDIFKLKAKMFEHEYSHLTLTLI